MQVIYAKATTDIPDHPISGKPTLVYWNICGLVQAIRFALVYSGVDFVDVRLDPGGPGLETYKKEWKDAKKGKLSKVMEFPNLPYFLDGNIALTQSDAILKHVGRTYKLPGTQLMGPTGQESRMDMLLYQLQDVADAFVKKCYHQGVEEVKEWYCSSIPLFLATMEKRVLDGKPFLLGDLPCLADIRFYDLLAKFRIIQSDLLSDTDFKIPQSLLDFVARIENLPRLKEYLSTEQYMARPLNNPHAKFGGD